MQSPVNYRLRWSCSYLVLWKKFSGKVYQINLTISYHFTNEMIYCVQCPKIPMGTVVTRVMILFLRTRYAAIPDSYFFRLKYVRSWLQMNNECTWSDLNWLIVIPWRISSSVYSGEFYFFYPHWSWWGYSSFCIWFRLLFRCEWN